MTSIQTLREKIGELASHVEKTTADLQELRQRVDTEMHSSKFRLENLDYEIRRLIHEHSNVRVIAHSLLHELEEADKAATK